MVTFFDGSQQAFAAALYIVWLVYKDAERRVTKLGVGDPNDEDFDPNTMFFHSILMSAKACVTPLRVGLTVPRSELSGLVLATRLQVRISKNYKPGLSSAHTLGDSTCVIACMSQNSSSFPPFSIAGFQSL